MTIYFDTSYILRLYLNDPGWEKARALAASASIAVCEHGMAECVSAFHRKFREGVVTHAELKTLFDEFDRDCNDGAFKRLPLSPSVLACVSDVYRQLPRTAFLRAADALHLACASQNGFPEIYSNDAHLLASARYFGLAGRNIL